MADTQDAPQDNAPQGMGDIGPDELLDEDDEYIKTNWHEVVDSFEDMNLRQELLRGVYGYGFEKPSAIQQRAIVPVCKGNDIIAQAQSGTGKTATFAISALQTVDLTKKCCQSLILAPTRELAQQIHACQRLR